MTADRPNASAPPLRTLLAVAIGLGGAAVIWLVTPYNNFVVNGSNISDSYLPAVVLFLILLLVLGVNPLLRWAGRGRAWALTSRQLSLAVGIMLVACVLPGQGLLRCLPVSLARTTREANDSRLLADQYDRMRLPRSLFPDPIGFHRDIPAVDGYLNEIRPDEPVPFRAWLGPLASWGTFLLFGWMMMIGAAMIVLPQWRGNERLAFPLLTLQQSLLEAPEPGRLLPPLFRRRSFWVAAGAVFLLYLMYGANLYYPEQVPPIPVKWDVTPLFTDELFRQMPGYIRFGRFYFIFIGLTFFMPTRISFSIWFFLVVYGLYRGFAPAFGWTDFIPKTDDQRLGAVVALTVGVLLVGRTQWARVFASMFSVGRPAGEEGRYNRKSGWTFVIGLAGMFGWLLWVGVQWSWAIVMVAFIFMVSLLLARFVAETGMPFVRLYENPLAVLRLAPASWLAPVTVFMAVMVDVIVSMGSRVNPAAMAVHAVALDDRAGPRARGRLGLLLIGSLAGGLVIAGAANLTSSYRHSLTLDGQSAIELRGYELANPNDSVQEVARGQLSEVPYNRYVHLGFGAGLAGGLYYLCLTVPQWPLHPFGMILVDSYYGHTTWASIFIGWLLQVLVVRFGGAKLYRLARPFFLGLIVGEVAAAIFWAIVPLILVALHRPFVSVQILPG